MAYGAIMPAAKTAFGYNLANTLLQLLSALFFKKTIHKER